MTVYIALLRGINVGGKNKIKMGDLRQLLEMLGLKRVETYIQSGNVIFESDEEEEILRDRIERGIESKFGFSSAIILRTGQELQKIIRECPFTPEEIKEAEGMNQEGESMYAAFMPKTTETEKVESLKVYESEYEECRLRNREVYLLLRHSIRTSKLAVNLTKLDMPSTVRNWKTINKLGTIVDNRGYSME
jgi:uncharacterized protein (DUF1697 family)